jgi:hypothetical protein
MSIPEFNDLGYLPPGVYESSWQEFMEKFVINAHRQRLATGLAAALRKLGVAGCRRVIIGGSFVTTKEKPNDFDGWYEDFGLDPNILDPLFVESVYTSLEKSENPRNPPVLSFFYSGGTPE